MKHVKILLVAGLLIASAAFTGCTSTKQASDTAKETISSAASAAVTEAETEQAEENKEVVLYDDNGIKLTYTGYKKDIFPQLTFKVENSSDKSYMVTTKDVSINDSMISTSIIETVAPGKKVNTNMTMLQSDLDDNGIESIEKVEFKLHCTNSDDFMDSFDSDVLVISNP